MALEGYFEKKTYYSRIENSICSMGGRTKLLENPLENTKLKKAPLIEVYIFIRRLTRYIRELSSSPENSSSSSQSQMTQTIHLDESYVKKDRQMLKAGNKTWKADITVKIELQMKFLMNAIHELVQRSQGPLRNGIIFCVKCHLQGAAKSHILK